MYQSFLKVLFSSLLLFNSKRLAFLNSFVIQKNYCFLYFPQKLSLTLKRLQGSFLSRRCLIFKVLFFTPSIDSLSLVSLKCFAIILQLSSFVNTFFQVFLKTFFKCLSKLKLYHFRSPLSRCDFHILPPIPPFVNRFCHTLPSVPFR